MLKKILLDMGVAHAFNFNMWVYICKTERKGERETESEFLDTLTVQGGYVRGWMC